MSRGSTPSLERNNKGVEAENRVDSTECIIVTGAIEKGSDQIDNDFKVEIIDRGG